MSRITCERGISYDQKREVYYLYMDLGRDDYGHRLRQYRTFPTLSAARKARNTFQLQRNGNAFRSSADLTLDQWLEEWMREIVIPNRAGTTIYGYQCMIKNYISPMLGDILLQDLCPKDLQHYYSQLLEEKQLGANTVRHHHALLSAALHAALRQDLIPRCVTDRVEPPRFIPKETAYYTAEHLKKLYQLIEGHPLETVVRLAGSLGLRREEICGLRWDSVDFGHRKLYIRAARTTAGAEIIEKETKNRSSSRVLHMSDEIYRLLVREWNTQRARAQAMGTDWPDSRLVIVDVDGVPLSPNRLTGAFSSFIRSNGLPPLTLHGLRHTFATVASSQGAPLFDIGKALGHSTPSTTGRIYTHLSDQFHTETLSKVAAALK